MKTVPLFHRQLLAGLALTVLASIPFAGPARADGSESGEPSVTDPYIRSLVPKDVAVITVPERVTVPTGGRSGWGEEIAAGLGGLLIGALLTATGAYFITYRRGVSTA
jgi:hypothetical protein